MRRNEKEQGKKERTRQIENEVDKTHRHNINKKEGERTGRTANGQETLTERKKQQAQRNIGQHDKNLMTKREWTTRGIL